MVIDSMSISARVSAKTSIKFVGGRSVGERKKRGEPPRASFPIALHPPWQTGDSEPGLTGLPNRKGLSCHSRFRRKPPAPFPEPPKRNRNSSPATHGRRTSTANSQDNEARKSKSNLPK